VRAGTVVVDAAFRGLAPGQVATVTVTVDGTITAQAALTPSPDGTATRALTLEHVPAPAVVTVDAHAGPATCTARLTPGQAAHLTCTPP
jgi:hypothetical protein